MDLSIHCPSGSPLAGYGVYVCCLARGLPIFNASVAGWWLMETATATFSIQASVSDRLEQLRPGAATGSNVRLLLRVHVCMSIIHHRRGRGQRGVAIVWNACAHGLACKLQRTDSGREPRSVACSWSENNSQPGLACTRAPLLYPLHIRRPRPPVEAALPRRDFDMGRRPPECTSFAFRSSGLPLPWHRQNGGRERSGPGGARRTTHRRTSAIVTADVSRTRELILHGLLLTVSYLYRATY